MKKLACKLKMFRDFLRIFEIFDLWTKSDYSWTDFWTELLTELIAKYRNRKSYYSQICQLAEPRHGQAVTRPANSAAHTSTGCIRSRGAWYHQLDGRPGTVTWSKA